MNCLMATTRKKYKLNNFVKMKSKIFKYFALLAMVGFLATSCDKWIDSELNKDPDSPQEVYAALTLSSTQLNLAWQYQGFDYSGTTGMWLQYYEGLDRQAYGTYNYTYSSDDCNNLYGSLYAGVLMDCKQIIDQTSVTGFESPHIRGMAKVMKALTLGTIVGLWGDVPYSEAFQGDGKLQPKFDTEESIYAEIQTILTEAIADLSFAGTDFEEKYIKIAAQDMIYGGDTDLWIKTAYALKARYEIRLSKKAGIFDADRVLGYLANSYESNDEDFQFEFTDMAYNEDNPLTQFSYERYLYAATSPDFIAMLEDDADPRALGVVIEDAGLGENHVGGYPLGYWFSPSLFISYAECKFIEAECQLATGDPDAAATAYNEAITASVGKWETAILNAESYVGPIWDATLAETWLTANAIETGVTITLAKVMNQKYIAMYGQGEAWSDYRRHDMMYPALTPPANNVTAGVQPQSYPYPSDEKISNGANVPTRAGLTNKLWAFQ